MKNKHLVPITDGWGYLFIILVFILPFLYLYTTTGQWNPFAVNGPRFLRFYGISCGGSAFVILIWLLFNRSAGFYGIFQRVALLTMLLGVARLCQGIYHAKPVSYLLLLMIVQVLLWPLGRVLYIKKR